MCTFVSFSGHCLSFQHFTVNCHSRIFKMFYEFMQKMFREWKWGLVLCTSVEIYQRLVSGVEMGYFEASFTAETRLWCGKSVIFISFTVKNKKPVSLICEITPVLKKKTKKKNTVFGLSKCRCICSLEIAYVCLGCVCCPRIIDVRLVHMRDLSYSHIIKYFPKHMYTCISIKSRKVEWFTTI